MADSFGKNYMVKPDTTVRLAGFDPDDTGGFSKEDAKALRKENARRIGDLQYKLYAENRQSLLIILQALDAGGKDGTIKDVMGAMNPQGCRVQAFKTPTPKELARDFLWRVHLVTPAKGQVVVFNRSHYEDVLIGRTHNLVPREIWMQRYNLINGFERLLTLSNTRIIKFYLNISKEEQLKRFMRRLDNPAKNWKISKDDYSERRLWDDYIAAFEDIFAKCSPREAPWYIIPANHKWFRNLAVSQIVLDTLEDMHIHMPEPTVDIKEIKKLAKAEKTASGAAKNKISEK